MWKKILLIAAAGLVAATGTFFYLIGIQGRASCNDDAWPQQQFERIAWQSTESKSRYVYAKSLIAQFSNPASKLTRSEIVELLGVPENEDHATFELEYLVGETYFCPMPSYVILHVGFTADGHNKAFLRFD